MRSTYIRQEQNYRKEESFCVPENEVDDDADEVNVQHIKYILYSRISQTGAGIFM